MDNQQNNRTTTNHHGKAVDLDIALQPDESKRADRDKCDAVRGRIVELSNAQVGWGAKNRKALEPPDVAPTSEFGFRFRCPASHTRLWTGVR